MRGQIGAIAGQAWEYLKSDATGTASQVHKGIGLDAAQTNQALGWLAREGKLCIDRSKSPTEYSLAE